MRPSSGSTLSNLNRSSMDNSFWMSAFPLEEYPGSDRRLATVEPRQFLVLPCVRVVSSPHSFTSIFFRKYGRARRSGSTFGKDSSLLYSPVVTNSKILVSLLRENTKKQRCRAPSRGGPDGPLPFPGRPAAHMRATLLSALSTCRSDLAEAPNKTWLPDPCSPAVFGVSLTAPTTTVFRGAFRSKTS
jgi:hypothetical protein